MSRGVFAAFFAVFPGDFVGPVESAFSAALIAMVILERVVVVGLLVMAMALFSMLSL